MKEINYMSPQKLSLCLDSIALLLYCGELVDCGEAPINIKEWEVLERKIKRSQIKRPAGLLSLGFEAIMINLEIEEELAMRITMMNKLLPNLLEQLLNLEMLGVFVMTKYEDNYPSSLKNKLKKEAPLILYYTGNIDLLNSDMICISGPSKSDRRIDSNTKKVVRKISNEGLTLISCGNRGVEKFSIKQQLKQGGRVVDFICGNIIQEMKEYIKPLKSGQMLMISAHHPFASFDLVQAIDRNQYVFILSKVAIIMYSQINSGAVWLVAMQNFTQKWTKLVAIMDDEFYGNARLVEHGAIGLTMDMLELDVPLFDLLEQVEEQPVQKEEYDQLSIYHFLGE